MQAYSNPKRESDPHALPDIEVWADEITEIHCRCGVYEVPAGSAWAQEGYCPSCERAPESVRETQKEAFFYWSCFPGCLPDSGPIGPFTTQEEALADAREGLEDEE